MRVGRTWISAVSLVLLAGVVVWARGAPEALPADMSVRLPVHAYRLSDSEEILVNAARRALIRDCMRGMGFPRHVVRIVDPAGPELTQLAYQRRYGVSDAAIARRWGYHLPRDAATAARHTLAIRQTRELPKAERLALGGTTGAGGCTATANRRLLAGVTQGDAKVVRKLDYDSFDVSRTDARLTAPLAAWRACMTDRGFRYEDPLGALAGGWDLDGPAPTTREIATATADVHCKQLTRLIPVWVAVETALQRRTIEANAAAFEKVLRAKNEYLANARRYAAG